MSNNVTCESYSLWSLHTTGVISDSRALYQLTSTSALMAARSPLMLRNNVTCESYSLWSLHTTGVISDSRALYQLTSSSALMAARSVPSNAAERFHASRLNQPFHECSRRTGLYLAVDHSTFWLRTRGLSYDKHSGQASSFPKPISNDNYHYDAS
ncbi:hypothetical protein J6590_003048 [Homalodisca vitripennis]|nr:hypothetical protein J6590_003048 [Homalodisca vitripennis]